MIKEGKVIDRAALPRQRRCLGFLLLLVFAVRVESAESPESPRLVALIRDLQLGKAGVPEHFWQEIARHQAPLTESAPGPPGEMLVTFLWRGEVGQTNSNVGVYGETADTGSPWETNERLKRLGDTDVWYLTHRMSDRARFSYRLSWPKGENHSAGPGGADEDNANYDLILDPRNPRNYEIQNSSQQRPIHVSYVEGPNAPLTPYLLPRQGVRRGKVETIDFDSRILGNRRLVTIYTPPGADRGCGTCDFLLLFDQSQFTSAVPTPTILDNLQEDGSIGPLVAVLVGNGPPPARLSELPPNKKLLAFVREELIPWVRARYAVTRDPQRSVIGGASLGGLAAAYIALKSPDLFGNVLSQSGSYWWWPAWSPNPIPRRG